MDTVTNQLPTHPVRVYSPYQEAIFTFCVDGQGNAIVEAVAGSGKTTTLVEAIRRILQVRPHTTVIFLAFNKSIAEELKKRGVNARTFHSLCYTVVLRHKGASQVNPSKLKELVRNNLGDTEHKLYGTFMVKLVGLARQSGIGCLVADTETAWQELADHHELELDSEDADPVRAIDLSRKLLRASNESPEVDFDDLLYVAVKEGLTLPKFDFVFVDEAQDTNAIQRALLKKLLRPASRVVAVGDPAQAIYGFRGADSDSMDLISQDFNAIRLPLTVSYRCPTSIVEYARQWVQNIEAAPGVTCGEVRNLGGQWKETEFQSGNLVVCRTTKPLVSLVYRLMRDPVPAKILGRKIGEGLTSLVNRMKARGIDQLLVKLQAYTEREVQKALAKNDEAKVEALSDRQEVIQFLISTLDENNRTIPALLALFDNLFTDNTATGNGLVLLATIHKVKGLKAERVFWLNSSKCPAKWARQPWQQQQERNLCYVATTRAQKVLTLIEDVALQPEVQA